MEPTVHKSPSVMVRHASWLCGIVLGGCAASVPMAPRTAQEASRNFLPAPDRAKIYVVRPARFKLTAVTVSVRLDGKSLGVLGSGTYLFTTLLPGRYTLLSASESEEPVTLLAEAGRNYFFLQEVAFGARAARTTLVRVDEEMGRAAVLRSEMAATQEDVAPPREDAGCSKDSDCKGSRICVSAMCTDPGH